MIAVIDYKAGNLTSVVKTLDYLGAREIGWTKKQIGDLIDHDDSGSVREFE